MSLQKVTYVSQQSVISAENLNNIQDAIIDLESSGGGGGSVFELASLTTAAMPSYEVAHNSNTIIHYQDYYYTSAGETGDGVDSWCIQYQCVTSVASAGNKMAASWLLLQYHPVTKVATYISLSFGTINGAVDNALSTTSTNAVQNKVITNALNDIPKTFAVLAYDTSNDYADYDWKIDFSTYSFAALISDYSTNILIYNAANKSWYYPSTILSDVAYGYNTDIFSQEKLTAGSGIKIEGNVISVTYENGNEVSY